MGLPLELGASSVREAAGGDKGTPHQLQGVDGGEGVARSPPSNFRKEHPVRHGHFDRH